MPDDSVRGGLVERVWWGSGPGSSLARGALGPLEALYRGVVALRARLYDRGALASHELAVPAISVGNLTVGGTGKTPISAHLAHALRARGAHPAIVLRGYGEDEPLVHAALNPDVPVVVTPDRVAGAREALRRGADIVVLDDAFQHRRARRAADVVLVSADRWTAARHLLPAGPWREPLSAIRRATLAVVTRKAASAEEAEGVARAIRAAAPGLPVATAALLPGTLHDARGGGEPLALEALRGARVLAVAAIGDPAAFLGQLRAAGARVDGAIFADHHRFTTADIARLASAAASVDRVVCTLKDAVKLAPGWPREAPSLWYVSQHVRIEQGRDALDAVLDAVLNLRHRQPSESAGANAGGNP